MKTLPIARPANLSRSTFAAGMIAAACTARASAAGLDRMTKVRIVTSPLDSSAEVLWAKDLGFFANAGIDADISLMNNGAEELAAISSGAMDIANSNVVSLASAYEHKVPLAIVAPGSLYSSKNPTTALVVAANGQVREATDLKGKTIAVSGLKNIAQVGAQAWLQKSGVDPSQITFIELPVPAMVPALVAGRIAGAVVVEPFLSGSVARGGQILAPIFDAIADSFLIGAWCCTDAWYQANHDVAKRFASVMFQTAKWANRNHSASAEILSKYTKAPIARDIRRVDWAESEDVAAAQALIDAAAKFRDIAAAFPASALFPDRR
jgi:NitT/TauT family transport system substrate-binding protein